VRKGAREADIAGLVAAQSGQPGWDHGGQVHNLLCQRSSGVEHNLNEIAVSAQES